MRILMILLLSVGLAHAEGEKAGDFVYYVLARVILTPFLRWLEILAARKVGKLVV